MRRRPRRTFEGLPPVRRPFFPPSVTMFTSLASNRRPPFPPDGLPQFRDRLPPGTRCLNPLQAFFGLFFAGAPTTKERIFLSFFSQQTNDPMQETGVRSVGISSSSSDRRHSPCAAMGSSLIPHQPFLPVTRVICAVHTSYSTFSPSHDSTPGFRPFFL